MKKYLVSIIGLVAMVMLGGFFMKMNDGVNKGDNISEEVVLKILYRQLSQAAIDKDVSMIRKIVREDAPLVHITGYVQSLSEWIQHIESEDMKYYSWEEVAVKDIVISENKASFTVQNLVNARIWGSGPTVWRLQVVVYFEKIDGQWQIVKQVASTY